MATPEDLKRLQSLLTQLNAIGNVQRGEVIRAEDWNAMVAAIVDVAQTVLSVSAAPAVPAHEHLDQITSAWLSPQLREIFERGPLADPATQQRLLEIEQRLRRLGEQLEANGGKVEEVRGRMTDVITRDLEREAAVTRVRRAVDNVIDPRPDITAMRNTLASIQGDMGTVLEAARRLNVGGTVVDMRALVAEVGELSQFRERFRLVTGAFLDAATVEQRLVEVSNRAVTEEELEEILNNRTVEIPNSVIEGLETRLSGSLREQVNGTLNTFGQQIRDEVTGRLNTVNDLVTSRLNEALPAFSETVRNSLQADINTARQQAIDAAIAGATQSLNTREQAIRTDMNSLLADMQASIATTVRTEIGLRLPAELTGVRSEIAEVSKRLDGVAAQSARNEATLNQHSVAIARIPQDNAALRNELRQMVIAEIDLRNTANTRAIDERLTAFEKAQTTRFNDLADQVRRTAVDEAKRIATETAVNEARNLRTQLIGEMRAIAREEINISVRDQVKTQVGDAVREQFAAVPGMIAAEVRRVSTTTIPRPGPIGPIVGGPR